MLTKQELRTLPKVELHRHLEGGVRAATAWDLAGRYGLDMGVASYGEFAAKALVPSPLGSLQDVLNALLLTRRTLCRYEAIERVAFENVEDAWHDGTRLLELRFAPTLLAPVSGLDYEEIATAVLEGALRAMALYPIEVGLIGSLRRKASPEANRQAADALLRCARGKYAGRLVGFDLADDENAADPELFTSLMASARDAGLGVTIHSGLNTDAEHVRRTLRALRPDRLGHGILILGDEPLIREIREKGMLLELSVTSNWLTASVPSVEEHPLPLLVRAGLSISVNTDDPQLFGIDLVHEYDVCQRLYGFGPQDFRRMNQASAAASFLPEEIRRTILARYFN